MNAEQKGRLKKLCIGALKIIVLGVIYFIITEVTDFWIPCIIKKVTGKYCPGCGITRMAKALIRLDFAAAARANIFLFAISPIALVYGVFKARQYVLYGSRPYSRPEQIGILIFGVLTVAYWVLRNIEAFSFLAPM